MKYNDMKYIRTLVGGLILIPAAVVFLHGVRVVYKANMSLRWPAAEGRVLSSGVEEVTDEDSGVNGIPRIGYAYSVGSVSYFSTRRAFIPATVERLKKAKEIVARYPVGKVVPVYYNPSKPAESVIEAGELSRTWDNVAAGIVFLTLGWLIYAPPRRKDAGARAGPRDFAKEAAADIRVRIQFRFNFLPTFLWIGGGIIMSRTFGSFQPTTVFLATTAVVVAGIVAESAWRRSWRVFRHNIEGVLAIIGCQIVLKQTGVDHLSLDLITAVIASTVVAYRKSKVVGPPEPELEVVASGGAAPDDRGDGQPADGAVPAAGGEGAAVSAPPVRVGKLRWVLPKLYFYSLAGAALFLAMMRLRRWAEDEAMGLLQPMYAWLAAVGFCIMVYGGCYEGLHWRCPRCREPLPERGKRKPRFIRCRKCGQQTPY